MGTDDDRFPADREGPVRSVDVPAFAIRVAGITVQRVGADPPRRDEL